MKGSEELRRSLVLPFTSVFLGIHSGDLIGMPSLTWHHSVLCLFMGWLHVISRLPLDSWGSPLASLC